MFTPEQSQNFAELIYNTPEIADKLHEIVLNIIMNIIARYGIMLSAEQKAELNKLLTSGGIGQNSLGGKWHK